MSEATQTQPQTQTLEQTLNKTDFGHILYENRKAFLAAIVAILVAACGYVFWKQSQKSEALSTSVQVFHFQSEVWANAKSAKLPPTDLVKAYESLSKEVQTAPVMLPVVLEMGKFLYEKGLYAEADTILSRVSDLKEPVTSFFINLQRSVVLEKLGKTDEAIATLEKLSKVKDGIMPAKVSLEIGRLYLLKGDKARAQTQFNDVVGSYPNDEQAKVAKLYLSQLAQ